MSYISEIEAGSTARPGRRTAVAAASSGWAELALAVGGFGIGTGEFAIMDCCRGWRQMWAFRYRRRGM